MHNILLLKGGGGTEHDISLISARYIRSQVDPEQFKVFEVEIHKDKTWTYAGEKCELTFTKTLKTSSENIKIHAVIPCIHGYPGETGDIQSFLEILDIPYLGCGPEASLLCFNKLVTKLVLENAGLKTTPFIQVTKDNFEQRAKDFFDEHKAVFVKATNQGSSVGCYKITQENQADLNATIKEAFQYSPYVIIEKEIKGRELEISAFEYSDQIHLTKPGEIISNSVFYDYHSKYAEDSPAKTVVEAEGVSRPVLGEIFRQAQIAYDVLQLRHLARIDFFLSREEEVYINEINTFPGHTKISMFPMMMENYGVKYSDFINQSLYRLVQK